MKSAPDDDEDEDEPYEDDGVTQKWVSKWEMSVEVRNDCLSKKWNIQ